MAYLYHHHPEKNEYSAGDIMYVGAEFEVRKITDLKRRQVDALMQEMCELNVFRKPSEGMYCFNSYRFYQMMGTPDAVEEGILNCME